MPSASPFDVGRSLPHKWINQDVTELVDKLKAGGLERIRLDIRKEYFSGRARHLWRSVDEFAEEMFPMVPSPSARRNLAHRLLNNPFGMPRYGPTGETIETVGNRLGLRVDERLREAITMKRKREATVRTVLPYVQTSWNQMIGDSPQLPFRPNEPFHPEFAKALADAGMPEQEHFTSTTRFNEVVEAIRATIPDATHPDCFWAAVWRMIRPFLPAFDLRLKQAASEAKDRGDLRGEHLLKHIETAETVLRAVRQSANAYGTGVIAAERVIEKAAERLSRHHGVLLTAKDLTGLLHTRDVTIQAIRDRQVGAGWLIWHDPVVRAIAHSLVPSSS